MTIAATPLGGHGVRLLPLIPEHASALAAAAADGALWQIRYTSVPKPADVPAYIARALQMQAHGERMVFAVEDTISGRVIGTTSYYRIDPAIRRVYIGYTWYGASAQRTHVNTASKLLLLEHAFGPLGCAVVAWRTDVLNTRSQHAIERLGAQRAGVLRHDQLRSDGSVRDTVEYSLLATEWPPVRTRLLQRLHAAPPC